MAARAALPWRRHLSILVVVRAMAAMFRLIACGFLSSESLAKAARKTRRSAAPKADADRHLQGGRSWTAVSRGSRTTTRARSRARSRSTCRSCLDLWAPWCHTCLSMQTTVFLDPSFGADNTRFVFAKLDTDREQNAGPMEKLAISAWPTFYVIDSASEAVLAGSSAPRPSRSSTSSSTPVCARPTVVRMPRARTCSAPSARSR